MHFLNIMESCRLAPLNSTTNGTPRASTTMCRLVPSLPRSVGLGPVSWPPGGLAPMSHRCWLNLVVLTQAHQHGLMQLVPYTRSIPVPQAPPAGHAASSAQRLRQVFPRDARMQHEQDAVESGFVANLEGTWTAPG